MLDPILLGSNCWTPKKKYPTVGDRYQLTLRSIPNHTPDPPDPLPFRRYGWIHRESIEKIIHYSFFHEINQPAIGVSP
jgi:hypothetical protein